MIIRKNYIEKIKPFIDKNLIKVLIGIRRSGKTVLLSQLRDVLIERGVAKENIVSINLESLQNRAFCDGLKLYDFILEKSRSVKGRLYLFFDEIQEVDGWEKIVNSFTVDIDCDIYLSGSNSKLLSGELATHIAGRYVHFDIYPFTLIEAKEISIQNGNYRNDGELFLDYLRYGGLPQRFSFSDGESIKAYLSDVYHTIVIKDIIERNKIKDIDLLKRLTEFLLDNAGGTFSARSITDYMRSNTVNIALPTVLNYVEYIKNAMIIRTARRYDIRGKSLLKTQEKYYSVDLGLRNALKAGTQLDLNRLYENAVYLAMLAEGYEVSVGKIDEKEVDFIATRGNEKMYIQVAVMLAEQSTVDREFGSLEKILDNYPKYVVTGEKLDFSKNGIKHVNISEFLFGAR
ncbi:MAG: ATP-binding protein [Clostridiales bacterium]|jgi:predicted AAA+ superfamily ATPase|nr:ATP-binding protein [Clostridiales bacterium]